MSRHIPYLLGVRERHTRQMGVYSCKCKIRCLRPESGQRPNSDQARQYSLIPMIFPHFSSFSKYEILLIIINSQLVSEYVDLHLCKGAAPGSSCGTLPMPMPTAMAIMWMQARRAHPPGKAKKANVVAWCPRANDAEN
jgi:hypothetical protein